MTDALADILPIFVALLALLLGIANYRRSIDDRRQTDDANLRRDEIQLQTAIFEKVQGLFGQGLREAIRHLGAANPHGDDGLPLWDYTELDQAGPPAATMVWERIINPNNVVHREQVINAVNWLDWFGSVLRDNGSVHDGHYRAEQLVLALGTPMKRLVLIGFVQARTSVRNTKGSAVEIEADLRQRYQGLIHIASVLWPDAPNGEERRLIDGWITAVVDETPANVSKQIGPI